MEALISVLLIGIFINTTLKISFWKTIFQIIFGVITTFFTIYMYPRAIEQSQTQMAQWLEDANILNTIAVLVTIETMLYIGFCFERFKKRKKLIFKILNIYSGLLIFPSLFYILAQSMFFFTGFEFHKIAISLGIFAGILIPIFCWGMKLLLPEKEIRTEMLLFMSLLNTILGLMITTNGKITYIPKNQTINLKFILYSLLFFAVLFALGFVISRLKWIYFSKKNQ